jgi:predicted DNA-binding ribbon-helix-helix protein
MNLSERTLKVNGRSMTLALEQELWARLDQRASELNCKVEVLVDLMLSGRSVEGSFVRSRATAS